MVMQRNQEILIKGKADAGKTVSVSFQEKNKSAIADQHGNWKVNIGRFTEGGPHELVIKCEEDSIILKNVMVGDVWICSGQSNMNMPLAGWGRVNNYEEEIKNANFPSIRLMTIPLTLAAEPQSEVNTKGWDVCSPETIANFTAAGYFFGREVYKNTNVPIGLIHVSKGGTPIETWMCEDALGDRKDLKKKISQVKRSTESYIKKIKKEYKNELEDFLEYTLEIDPGYTSDPKWYKIENNYSNWKKMNLPGVWETELGNYDGIVWFSKEVEIPENWLGNDITLDLGPVQDYDITYFNSKRIGDQPSRNNISIYSVDKKLVKPGKNRITVRVLDFYGAGGLWGVFDKFELRNVTGESISLTGTWEYKPSLQLKEIDREVPKNPNPDRYPMILFNGMISPLLEYRVAGVVWYQGESNSRNAYQYREMFPRMINHWREHFNNPRLNFYFVQLANYSLGGYNIDREIWATLRESQAAALKLPNTGMATAIDLGNEYDVHPKNKQEVGRRLALQALHGYYGQEIPFSGPVYESYEITGEKIVLTFSNLYDGFKIKDGELPREFEIAGGDEKFYPAIAEIASDKIVVSSKSVKYPVAVRYAWKNNPNVNLYNSVNLPLYPFRTDNFDLE